VKATPDTLTLPATRGVRLVAMELLGDAAQAADRLAHARDNEALHDFRVAVRKLRSWLRAFDKELGASVRRRDRRALRTLVRATSFGRDTEVQLEWLARVAKSKDAQRKHGATRLSEYIREQQRLAGDSFDESCIDDFTDLHKQLMKRFEKTLDDSDDDEPTLAHAIAAEVPTHVDALTAALHAVHAFDDETPAHEARIAAKRLRYLLEPAAARERLAAAMVDRLKTMQDDLGELHDMHVLGHVLREAIADMPITDIQDLVSVAARLERDTKRIFRRFERVWLENVTAVRKLGRDATTVAQRLDALKG
jgi:CHAD domain-containing protein